MLKTNQKEFISQDFSQYFGDRVSTVARPTRRPTYRPIVSTVTRPRGAQITQDPFLSRKATVKSLLAHISLQLTMTDTSLNLITAILNSFSLTLYKRNSSSLFNRPQSWSLTFIIKSFSLTLNNTIRPPPPTKIKAKC